MHRSVASFWRSVASPTYQLRPMHPHLRNVLELNRLGNVFAIGRMYAAGGGARQGKSQSGVVRRTDKGQLQRKRASATNNVFYGDLNDMSEIMANSSRRRRPDSFLNYSYAKLQHEPHSTTDEELAQERRLEWTELLFAATSMLALMVAFVIAARPKAPRSAAERDYLRRHLNEVFVLGLPPSASIVSRTLSGGLSASVTSVTSVALTGAEELTRATERHVLLGDDSLQVRLEPETSFSGIDEAYQALFSPHLALHNRVHPDWVILLFKLRNLVPGFAPLYFDRVSAADDDVDLPSRAEPVQIGDVALFGHVKDRNDCEIVVGVDDWHADFRMALRVHTADDGIQELTLCHAARPHNLVGRVSSFMDSLVRAWLMKPFFRHAIAMHMFEHDRSLR